MKHCNAKHYLEVYKTRLQMQEEGITNPPSEIKLLTRTIVEKLSELPSDEIIILQDRIMKDSKGNIIVKFP